MARRPYGHLKILKTVMNLSEMCSQVFECHWVRDVLRLIQFLREGSKCHLSGIHMLWPSPHHIFGSQENQKCWNSQSVHLQPGGGLCLTTHAISWRSSFRTVIVNGPGRVRKQIRNWQHHNRMSSADKTRTHTHTRTYTHTRTNARTHTHSHTHSHTHTHTQLINVTVTPYLNENGYLILHVCMYTRYLNMNI